MSHIRALSSLDLGSVDVEGGSGARLDEDYFEGIPLLSSGPDALPWTAAGPMPSQPHHSGSPTWFSTTSVAASLRAHAVWARAGIKDSLRGKEVLMLFRDSAPIRMSLIKGFVLSAAVSLLIFFFELTFWPSELFKGSGTDTAATAHSRASESATSSSANTSSTASTWNVILLYPVIALSYLLASSWLLDVAKVGHEVHHGRGSMVAMASSGILSQPHQPLLVVNYTLIALALRSWVPFVGKALSFVFISFVCAYYCFDPVMANRGWSIERRLRFAESRWAYMTAFGLLPTAVSYFHPSGLLNLFLFMLIYPPFTVLALLANPQPQSSPKTSSSHATTPSSGSSGFDVLSGKGTLSPLLPGRIPIFMPTVILCRLLKRFVLPRPRTDNVHDDKRSSMSGGLSQWTSYTSHTNGFGGAPQRRTAAQFVGGVWQQQQQYHSGQGPPQYGWGSSQSPPPRQQPAAPVPPPPKRSQAPLSNAATSSSHAGIHTSSHPAATSLSPQRHRAPSTTGGGGGPPLRTPGTSPQEAAMKVNPTVRVGPPPKGKKAD
ncbi:unnamed protein product [Parajaminaea phylloscopi]